MNETDKFVGSQELKNLFSAHCVDWYLDSGLAEILLTYIYVYAIL